jgi:hypothetical protein
MIHACVGINHSLAATSPPLIEHFACQHDPGIPVVPPSVITLFVRERDSDLSAVPPSVITLIV